MTNRQWAGALLAGLMLPAALLAQNPPKYVGDDGAYSPGTPRNRTAGDGSGVSAAGSAMNLNYASRERDAGTDRRATPYRYERYRRQPDGRLAVPLTREWVTIGITPGTNPPAVIPTAAEWLAFQRDRIPNSNDVDFDGIPDNTQPQPRVRLSSEPPRQKLLVVDQAERKRRLDAGQQPEVIVWKTQTIVTRWTEVIPQYRNDSVVGYPCCCTITFSVLTGYRYVEHVETTYRQVPEAEYSTTAIAVNRGIVLVNGSPQYSTQIPRLCEFHYGPGAVYTAPVVPLIADINDRPAGGSSNTTNGTATTTTNTLITSQNTTYVQDINHNTIATNSASTVQTNTSQTVVIPIGTRPLIPGTAPSGGNFGGIALNANELTRNLEIPAGDRGTATHPGDQAYVVQGTASDGSAQMPVPGDPEAPFKYNLK